VLLFIYNLQGKDEYTDGGQVAEDMQRIRIGCRLLLVCRNRRHALLWLGGDPSSMDKLLMWPTRWRFRGGRIAGACAAIFLD
jgi:hypothetical protein